MVETCIVKTKAADGHVLDPAQWKAACELKATNAEGNKSVFRKLSDLHKYGCFPAEDLKELLEWAHSQ